MAGRLEEAAVGAAERAQGAVAPQARVVVPRVVLAQRGHLQLDEQVLLPLGGLAEAPPHRRVVEDDGVARAARLRDDAVVGLQVREDAVVLAARAAEVGAQVVELVARVADLRRQRGGSRSRLKEMNGQSQPTSNQPTPLWAWLIPRPLSMGPRYLILLSVYRTCTSFWARASCKACDINDILVRRAQASCAWKGMRNSALRTRGIRNWQIWKCKELDSVRHTFTSLALQAIEANGKTD